MIRVRPVVVGVVIAVLVSLLGGCSLFEDDPQTQLDKIIAKTGNDIVGMKVVVKTDEQNPTVSIFWVDAGKVMSAWLKDGKVIVEDSRYPSFATTGPTSVDNFSLDSYVSIANGAFNPDGCYSAIVTSMVTPTGAIGAQVECLGREKKVIDEQSMLDGELFYVPRVDPQVAADLDVLKQAYVTVMGTSKVHRFSYYFNQALLSLDGPVATNVLGESCVPSMTALLSSSSTPFPVSCDTKATVGSNPFDVNEFSSTSVAEVVASVENSQVLDYQSLASITFFHQGEDLCWEVTTTSIGDLSAHRDQLKGCITKGA